MTQKTKRVIWIILMIIPSLMIVMSAVLKLLNVEAVVQQMTQVGFGDYLPVMAIAELLFVVLFFIPKTYKIGFLLLTCYVAGAMALEIAGGRFPTMGVVMAMIWISVFLRNKYMFLPADNQKQVSSS